MWRGAGLKARTCEEEVGRDDTGNQGIGQIAEITLKSFREAPSREKELRQRPDQVAYKPHPHDYRGPRWIHCSIPQPTVPMKRAVTSHPHSAFNSAPGTAKRKLAMPISSAVFLFNSTVRMQAK